MNNRRKEHPESRNQRRKRKEKPNPRYLHRQQKRKNRTTTPSTPAPTNTGARSTTTATAGTTPPTTAPNNTARSTGAPTSATATSSRQGQATSGLTFENAFGHVHMTQQQQDRDHAINQEVLAEMERDRASQQAERARVGDAVAADGTVLHTRATTNP